MNVIRQGIVKYNQIGWLIIIPFTSVTDLSDVSNPLNIFLSEVMIEYVQARPYWLITC